MNHPRSQIKNQRSKIACVLCLVFLCSIPAFGAWEKWLGLPIVGVDYKCNGDFSRDEVSKATVIQTGDVYSRSAIGKSVANIYSLGGFSDVKADAQLTENGVFLTFILTRETKTGEIYLVRSLFSIGLEYRIDLDKMEISRGLLRQFDQNGVSLSQDANVSVKSKDSSWLIEDKGKTYFVRGDGTKLGIYLVDTERLGRNEIIQVMRLKPGREYDDSIARVDVESIKRLYASRGYFDADVSFLPPVSNGPEQADVVFVISEGGRSVVGEIIFIGTGEAVTRTRMLGRINLEFQSDLDTANISAGLLRELKDKGASLSDEAAVSVEKTGSRWLITDVQQIYSIRKEAGRLRIYRTKSLLEVMKKVKLGEVYGGQQDLDSDAKLIVKEMREQAGYITAKIKKTQALSDPDAIKEYQGKGTHFASGDVGVVVVIEIEQGRKVYVEVEGNSRIKDDKIKRAIAVQRMYSVSESVLRKSDEDIKKLYTAKGYYLAKVEHEVLRDKVWDFHNDGDSKGWKPSDKSTSLDVSDRAMKVLSPNSVPLIESPEVKIYTDKYQKVIIRMRSDEGSTGRLYWTTDRSGKWDEKRHMDLDVISDGRFHDYMVDMLDHDGWSDTVTRLRVAPVDVPGSDVDISSIKVITESITVVFRVTENQLMRIGKISIIAPEGEELNMDVKDIKRQMLTRKRNLLSFWWLSKYLPDGILDEIVYQMDLRAIIAFYKDKGYINARIVSHEEIPKPEKHKIDITIAISEGPRTFVSAVVLERGKAILGDREVLSNLMVIPGFNEQNLFIEGPDSARIRYEPASPKAFREEDVVEDRSFLRARYADEGYLYAQIDAIREFSDDLTEVVITYRITEGEKVRIADDIGIKGNNRTKHRVIERELSDRLTEEKYFSYTEIAESWQRLLDLGIFESVRIDTEPITETGDIVKMTVEVKERNAISANLHAGFGSSEDLRAGIEATHINLWGTNRKLGGKVQIGTKGTRGEINYSEPRLLGTGAVGLIDIYRYSEKDYKDYPVTRTGGTVGIRQRLHRANTLTYRYRYDHVKYEDEDMIERVTDIGRIETTFQRDTRRDSRLNPKRGWLNVLALEYADDRLGGSETFAKFMLNSARYTSLSQNVVLALGARTGYAWELGSTKRILTPERFDLSDYTTPRGYDWTAKDDGAEDAGSAMIGNFILNTSVELRFPIYKWIGGGIFFDSGYVCDEISDFDVRSMKSSVGLGLRFSTPIGPVRLDYGYPVRGDGNRYYWPHLAIGHAF